MSSISISTALSSLSPYSTASSSGATVQARGTSATAESGPATDGVHGAHRHRPRPAGPFPQELQDAVITALDNAKSQPSSDPNKIVEEAIAKVLGNPKTAHGPRPAGGRGGDPDGDGDVDSPTGPDNDGPNAAQQAFFRKLQEFGIDPEQFRRDFESAVKNALSGQEPDPSSAFKAFPPGLTVDTPA